ncbi:hypothetical protein GCM10010168_14890 [Actinoplanes ianthinogenes]|uniref:Transposase n=1 Tax=Actinoplanes ianthinogenes TaxID=122358 RepID=A0ABM7LZF9_9ACTN|nr:hypothetical protein Aiant_53330 [Actinoplanes ianthinogenes]GGQ99324.1 hypothetical protein GCM10010168_14890 [Actinoplanes ianthinogenes]
MRAGSTAVTSPPSDRFHVLTESNAKGLPDVTVEMVTTEVTGSVMCVVDLATNRSVVNVRQWSRRTLRSVIDWSDKSSADRSGGAWTTQMGSTQKWPTQCESEGPACD